VVKVVKLKLLIIVVAILGLVGLFSACTYQDRITDDLYVSNLFADGNVAIGDLSTSYTLTLNGLPVSGSGMIPLTSAHLYVGNALNVATDVAASGDLTLTNYCSWITRRSFTSFS
jgi:hypothetical protein